MVSDNETRYKKLERTIIYLSIVIAGLIMFIFLAAVTMI